MKRRLPQPARGRLRHLVKYASVSAVSTATSLSILALLVGVLGWPAVASNVVATAIGTVPSFELNRRWVWSQRRGRRRAAQVVPFCLLSLSGLLVSSAAVHLAAELTAGDGRPWRTAVVEAASIASYGALWLVQFFLCDKVLFRARPVAPGEGEPGSPEPSGSQPALSPAPQDSQDAAVDYVVAV